MIFFFDANGNPIQNIPQKVYQGSNKASVIYFAYPLSSTLANVVFVNAAFNLPNGFNTEPQLMVKVTDTGLSNITDAEGNVYSVWQLSLIAPITSYSGNVTCQFFVTTSSAVVATASSQFFVEKGVLPVNPPAEGDSYQELLQYITDILTPLANEVEDLSNSYYPRQTGVSILENLVKVQDGVLSASIAPNIIALSDNTVTNNLKAQAPAEDDELASIYNNYLPKKDGVLVVQDDVTSVIETALVPIQRELDDKYDKVDNVSIDTMGVTVIDASDSGDFAGLYAYGIELTKNGTPTNLSSQETPNSTSINLLLPNKSGTLALDGDLQDLEDTLNTKIDAIQGIKKIEVVTELPTENISTTTLYLLKQVNGTSLEYLYVNGAWEPVGSTNIEVSVTDVQINGTSIVENGIANIPIAANKLGLVKSASTYGVGVGKDGTLNIYRAYASHIKGLSNIRSVYCPITPINMHYAVKTAIATMLTRKDAVTPSGVSLDAEYSEVLLSDSEKAAAQEWLGITGGAGGTLYLHKIVIRASDNTKDYHFEFQITSTKADAYTLSDFDIMTGSAVALMPYCYRVVGDEGYKIASALEIILDENDEWSIAWAYDGQLLENNVVSANPTITDKVIQL